MLAGLLCSLYLILFVLGIGTNTSALIKSIKVYRLIRKFEWSSDGSSNGRSNNPKIRIGHLIWFCFILIITNFSLLLCLCFLISDVLSQGWHLGSTLCWYYWWSENISKTFMAFLLSVFNMERYLSLCNKSIWKWISRNTLTMPITVAIGSILVFILASPLQPYVDVQILIVESPPSSGSIEIMNLTKCGISDHIPKVSLKYHVIGSFIFAYICPLFVSILCYISIVIINKKTTSEIVNTENQNPREARLPSDSSGSSSSTVIVERADYVSKRITIISTALIILYLICWAPYWLTTLIIQFGNPSHTSAFTLPFTLFICHVLPYVNATVSGQLLVALAKRVKALKLSDIFEGGGGEGREGAGEIDGEEGKAHYHEMVTRVTLDGSNGSVSG